MEEEIIKGWKESKEGRGNKIKKLTEEKKTDSAECKQRMKKNNK